MSGRSAYVRKKITEPKDTLAARGRSKSGTSRVSADDSSFYEYPVPQGTGYGTTNARLLKFSDPGFDGDAGHYRTGPANHGNVSDGSQSGSSGHEGPEGSGATSQGPMPAYAYARARKPVLRTEDVSGIERSGFRSAVDKKSDGIRKGLTKAFTLGLKKKKESPVSDRAPSSATIRPHYYDTDDYDNGEIPAVPAHHRPIGGGGGMGVGDYQPAVSPPPSARLPPIPASTAPPIKRWIGGGRPVQRWNKLRKDPELWDPNGDVLVYFGRRDQPQRPNPSFRLSSHIIEATESRLLVTMLREGSTEDDYAHINLPPSPVGAPPMLRHNGYLQAGQATPPVSEENAQHAAAAADVDGQISYEMYFPTPANLTKTEAHRHAITTRNVFALLYHASLVGLSLFQALRDLLGRLDAYMEPDADNVGAVLNYLTARGIDDARGDAETAVSVLAWSETPEVRWEEGWREAFLHCAGMYGRLERCADFRYLTPITRALLERASLETQLRVRAAEERLAAFAYADIWGPAVASGGGGGIEGAGKNAAERLRLFLISHYAKVYGGAWPPDGGRRRRRRGGGDVEEGREKGEAGEAGEEEEDMWLTRTIAQMLQRDFGALYDYLVNRDIVWDESETRSSRKWMMVSRSGNRSFDADTEDLPLTDLLIEFDNRLRFPHIPHPYPLVPDSIPPAVAAAPPGVKPSRKDKNAKSSAAAAATPIDGTRTLERRIQLAYTEATNIYSLGSDFAPSELVEGFVRFEKTDQIGAVDPACARRARWVLIYAVLQTLASVSVDAPNARYKDGVSYHLSPRLRGSRTPPWKGISPSPSSSSSSSPSSSPAIMEASHELSHCWVVPRSWHPTHQSAVAANTATHTTSPNVTHAAAELEASSAGTDAVLRMMHSGRSQQYPRPPPSTTGTSRSSLAGWHTPSSAYNSARPSNTATPTTMWGGSSAVSVSNFSDDTATTSGGGGIGGRIYNSSSSSRGLLLPRLPSPRGRVSNNNGNDSSSARSERSVATFGPGANVRSNLHHGNNGGGGSGSGSGSSTIHTHYNSAAPFPIPVRGESPQWPARTHSIYRTTQPPAPLDLSLTLPQSIGKGGEFLLFTNNNNSNNDRDTSLPLPYTPTSAGGGEPAAKGGLPSPLSSEILLAAAGTPVIRDFDELDSVAEEEGEMLVRRA